jgi:hypothetical protein
MTAEMVTASSLSLGHWLLWWAVLVPGVFGLLAFLWFEPAYAIARAGQARPLAGAGVAGLLGTLGVITVGGASGARYAARPAAVYRGRCAGRELRGLIGACAVGLALFGAPTMLGVLAAHAGALSIAGLRALVAMVTLLLVNITVAGLSAWGVRRRGQAINPTGVPRVARGIGLAYIVIALLVAVVLTGQGDGPAAAGVATEAAGLRWIPITGWSAWGLTDTVSSAPAAGWALLGGSLLVSAAAAARTMRSLYRSHPNAT